MDLTAITPTPAALRALAHPVRLRMLGLLRIEGPATATALAMRLGLNTGATSYHLRHLAQHGFIVEDPERGNARDRWWRAVHQATTTGPEPPGDQEAAEVLDAYLQSVAVVLTGQLQRAMEERPLLPEAWRNASEFGDYVLRLTPARARRLRDALHEVILGTEEDPEGGESEQFVVQLTAFPRPGTVTGDPV
ncbi:MAG TPA: helix-turn-helix domain-containing protein [Jiangellaceae bacterium]